MAGRVLREMRPALRQRDYGDALTAAAETVGSTIAQAKQVGLDTEPPPRRYRETSSDSIPWPMIVGGGLFLLFWLMRGGPRGGGGFLTGLLMGSVLSRGSGGGRGGGGFGGFDSGGGFGGFGGGDSGGGGASSDW
jgi:uncharacterized protein